MTIEKIIHQMWLDKNDELRNSSPTKYDDYCQTFKILQPEIKYMFWNMSNVKKLFETNELKRFQTFFNNTLHHHIEKCDFARLAVLYTCGGIYIDLDYKCIKPFDEAFFKDYNAMFLKPNSMGWINNGHMASTKGHSIWIEIMQYIKDNYNAKNSCVLNTTGPIALGKFLKTKNVPSYFSADKNSRYVKTDSTNGSFWQLSDANLALNFMKMYTMQLLLFFLIATILIIFCIYIPRKFRKTSIELKKNTTWRMQ